MSTLVDLHIPVQHEPAIARTLQSIYQQQLPEDVVLKVIIFVNGSSDNTAELAYEAICGLPLRPDMEFVVFETNRPGRTVALNLCLWAGEAPLIIRTDGDVAYAPGTLEAIIQALLGNPALMMSGGARGTIITPELQGSMLGQVYRVRQIIQDLVGEQPWPIGRLMATRRSVFDRIGLYSEKFFGAEDTWLVLKVFQHFGWDAISMAPGAVAYATPPGNWIELLKQQTRWIVNPSKLLDIYPELEVARQSMQARLAQRREQILERREEILAIMEREGISSDILDLELETLPAIFGDNALLNKGVTTDRGIGESLKTTKRTVGLNLRSDLTICLAGEPFWASPAKWS